MQSSALPLILLLQFLRWRNKMAFIPDFMSSVLSFLSNMPNMKLQGRTSEYQHIINEREKNKDKAANKYMMDANDLDKDLSRHLQVLALIRGIAGLHVDNVLPEGRV